MTIQHNLITGSDLHEPKGVAAASNKTVYVANGSGSGSWTKPHSEGNVYITFNASSPTYTQANTTSDVIVNPTFSSGLMDQFTLVLSPNARIRYDGSATKTINVFMTTSCKQASGSAKDVEFALFKNGTEITGSRVIRTMSTGSWGSLATAAAVTMATNDYLELKSKTSASATVEYAALILKVSGNV